MSSWTFNPYKQEVKQVSAQMKQVTDRLRKLSQVNQFDQNYDEDTHSGQKTRFPAGMKDEYREKVGKTFQEMASLLSQIAPVMNQKTQLHKQIVAHFKNFMAVTRTLAKVAPFDPMARQLLEMSSQLAGPKGFKVKPIEAAQTLNEMATHLQNGDGEATPLEPSDVKEPTNFSNGYPEAYPESQNSPTMSPDETPVNNGVSGGLGNLQNQRAASSSHEFPKTASGWQWRAK